MHADRAGMGASNGVMTDRLLDRVMFTCLGIAMACFAALIAERCV